MILNLILFFSKIGFGLGYSTRTGKNPAPTQNSGFWVEISKSSGFWDQFFKMSGFWVKHSEFGLGRKSVGWATQPNADPWYYMLWCTVIVLFQI